MNSGAAIQLVVVSGSFAWGQNARVFISNYSKIKSLKIAPFWHFRDLEDAHSLSDTDEKF